MERKSQPPLDKAIGPAGLPSLRSALALSAATYKDFIVIWQVRNADYRAGEKILNDGREPYSVPSGLI
jgi:hypothetical protein